MAYVFISYQRSASTALAYLLKDALEKAGLTVYLDTESRQELGPLEPQIIREIQDCTVFLCLLEETTLNSAWVVKEIETAVSAGKQCLPVLHERFTFPANAEGAVKTLLGMAGDRIYDRSNIFFPEHIQRIVQRVVSTVSATTAALPEFALRILIIENEQDWIDRVREAISEFLPNSVIMTASTVAQAHTLMYDSFDLIMMDLDLGEAAGFQDGIRLCEMIRAEERARPTGLLILSILADPYEINRFYERFRPVYLNKMDFSEERLHELVTTAIRRERMYMAKERAVSSFLFQFEGDGLELGGVDNQLGTVQNRARLNVSDYTVRFEHIRQSVVSGTAQSSIQPLLNGLGDDISKSLLHDSALNNQFQQIPHKEQTRIVIGGDASVHGVPFEVARFDNHLAAARMPIVRRLRTSHRPVQSFAQLVQDLVRRNEPLQVALIGRPESEEIRHVGAAIALQTRAAGILHSIHHGSDVQSYVEYLSETGKACHMLHIAYPIAANIPLPLLAQLTNHLPTASCRFVFANAGLGDHTWLWADKLVQAGVSSMVMHQVAIEPDFAARFAARFYNSFLITLDAALAVFRSRLIFLETNFNSFAPVCVEAR